MTGKRATIAPLRDQRLVLVLDADHTVDPASHDEIAA
jgi:hypothetical protein